MQGEISEAFVGRTDRDFKTSMISNQLETIQLRVALFAATMSYALKKKISRGNKTYFTDEISRSGEVLAVGDVKGKAIAAILSSLKQFFHPFIEKFYIISEAMHNKSDLHALKHVHDLVPFILL